LTSPHYPQSNGKIERFHRTLKEQAIRPKTSLTLEDAQRVAGTFIDHDNQTRLHSALGYVTPADRLAGRRTRFSDNAIKNWNPHAKNVNSNANNSPPP